MEKCNTDERNRLLLNTAVYLILIKDDQLLLQKRANTGWQDGKYSLVSGHMDGRKTVASEMARETKEETGLIIKPEDLKVVHIAHHLSNKEYVDFFLTASKWDGEPVNLEPNKCDELAWFSLDNLPSVVEDVRDALEHYHRGEFFSEFDWNKL